MPDMLSIRVTASGFDKLEEDAKAILSAPKIQAQITEAVNEYARNALADHVQSDVYDGPYQPREYLRRSDTPVYGKSLKQSAYEAKGIGPADGGNWVAGIDYEPTGEHANYEWDTADGDRLIGRIEHKSPMYTYYPKFGHIPDRPFWTNFVEEMIEGGGFDEAVITALQEQGFEIESAGDVIRESGDGNY